MNRISILSFVVVLGGVSALIATTAQSQVGPPKAYVGLQPTTPGISQSGHANVSGTLRASQHIGGGAGLTGVNADLLDGINSTAFLQSVPNPLLLSGSSLVNPIIRATNSSTFSSAIIGESTATTSGANGVVGITASTTGRGVSGQSNATTGSTYGGYFSADSTSGRGVFANATANSGTTYGVYGLTASSSGYGVYGLASSASGLNYGVYGEANSTSGRGVYGTALATSGTTYGGQFVSASPGGAAVFGRNTATSGNPAYGVLGYTHSTDGSAVYGHALSGSGDNYGGRFYTDSPDGIGVFGGGQSNTGTATGVFGQSNSTSGRGVYGTALATSGVNYGGRFENDSTAGRAVYALASATSGTNYGVRGESNSTTGWGVYSVGDMGASGTKPFRIDHPFDPENKYLLHYASESPMPQNFYVGNVTTDSNGYAWVELPDYFNEINTNFKYQLTVVDGPNSGADDFVQVKVRQKIVGNRFQIRTSAPNVEVSWRVDADRNDLYVQKKQPKDVVEKEGFERGKYQHPELYGYSKARGMDFHQKLPLPMPTSSK